MRKFSTVAGSWSCIVQYLCATSYIRSFTLIHKKHKRSHTRTQEMHTKGQGSLYLCRHNPRSPPSQKASSRSTFYQPFLKHISPNLCWTKKSICTVVLIKQINSNYYDTKTQVMTQCSQDGEPSWILSGLCKWSIQDVRPVAILVSPAQLLPWDLMTSLTLWPLNPRLSASSSFLSGMCPFT